MRPNSLLIIFILAGTALFADASAYIVFGDLARALPHEGLVWVLIFAGCILARVRVAGTNRFRPMCHAIVGLLCVGFLLRASYYTLPGAAEAMWGWIRDATIFNNPQALLDNWRGVLVFLLASGAGIFGLIVAYSISDKLALVFDGRRRSWVAYRDYMRELNQRSGGVLAAAATGAGAAGTAVWLQDNMPDNWIGTGVGSVGSDQDDSYINPASGLPMLGGIGGVDVGGNLYGQSGAIGIDSTTDFGGVGINPASGLPMIDGMGGVDVAGNPFGTDFSDDMFSSGSGMDDSFSIGDDVFDSSSSFDDSFGVGSSFDDHF